MKDISLYGHLTIDTIIDGVKERKTLGSMANVWKALLELDATLDARQLREFGETFYRTGKTATNVQKRAKGRSSIQRARSYFGSKLREY